MFRVEFVINQKAKQVLIITATIALAFTRFALLDKLLDMTSQSCRILNESAFRCGDSLVSEVGEHHHKRIAECSIHQVLETLVHKLWQSLLNNAFWSLARQRCSMLAFTAKDAYDDLALKISGKLNHIQDF